MPVAQIKNQRIYFEDIGSGLPIVLGHSFLCTGEMWREQIRALERRYRIINLDFRGHGRSGPAQHPFTLYDALEDVIGVLDLLDIERAVWCGLSIGGMVAIRAALAAPDRVDALVLLDCDAGAESLYRKLKFRSMGVGVKFMGLRPFLPAIASMMFGSTTRQNNPRLVDEWCAVFADVDVPSALHCVRALVERDSVASRLPEIAVRSRVMVGEEDQSLPPACSYRVHEGLSNSEYIVVREAGHLSALEQPGQVNDALERFLLRLAESSPPG